MPKLKAKQFWRSGGRLHREISERDGVLNGVTRHWHPNGKKAMELCYQNGVMHGTSRQWDSKGKLLGRFKIKEGTGTQRYWHENGRLKMEADYFKGILHGRLRLWLQDGTLIKEDFSIHGVTVSRAVYLKKAQRNPEWPQYREKPAQQIVAPTPTLRRKELRLAVQFLLKRKHSEAQKWLSAKRTAKILLPTFQNAKEALLFVDRLYAAGATSVIAAPIYPTSHRVESADWLLVQMPKTKPLRREIRQLCRAFCQLPGRAMEPEKDFGQSHLLLRLESDRLN